MSQELKNLFLHEFAADIWRMEPDPVGQQLGVELRDGEAMEVTFALLDLGGEEPFPNGLSHTEPGLSQDRLAQGPLPQDRLPQLRWDGLAFDSGWWTGLSGLHQGIMLLYTYEDQQNPELKNVFALDTQTQEVCWAYEGYNHLHFYEGSSLGFSRQGEERSYARIELVSGSLSSLPDEEGLALLKAAEEESQKSAAEFAVPDWYGAENPYLSSMQTFLEKECGVQAVNGCEYLEIFDKIIISYYTANGEKLSNFILVCNIEGEMLLHEQIREAGEGVALDTFFVMGRKLIFTKEQRIIACYEI